MNHSKRVHLIHRAGVCLLVMIIWGCGGNTPGGSVDDTLRHAWKSLRLGEQEQAKKLFESVVARATQPDQKTNLLLAKYGLAIAFSTATEPEAAKARQLYQEILASKDNQSIAPWAALGLVRQDHLFADIQSAEVRERIESAYEQLIDQYPGSPAADEAFVYLQTLRLIAPTKLESVRVADDTKRAVELGQSRFLSSVYSLRQAVLRNANDHTGEFDAVKRSIETRELDPSNPAGADPSTLYAAAVIAQFDLGDFKTAREYYERFLKSAPNDSRSFTVHQLLADMDRLQSGQPSLLSFGSDLQAPDGGAR